MGERYPRLSDRFQSTIIDSVLLIVMMLLVANIINQLGHVPTGLRIILFVAIIALYEPLCTTFGCTLGNYIKGIRVKKYSNTTKRIHLFQAIIRYVVKILLGWVSFLTMNSNPQRRAIHDLFAGSVMIKI